MNVENLSIFFDLALVCAVAFETTNFRRYISKFICNLYFLHIFLLMRSFIEQFAELLNFSFIRWNNESCY